MMGSDDDRVHGDLIGWIARNGGAVHGNLALVTPPPDADGDCDREDVSCDEDPNAAPDCGGRYSRRGIFARHGPIAKGEVLVRLPRRLALDGSGLPSNYELHHDDAEPAKRQRRNASPWLRCLASLVRSQSQTNAAGAECSKRDSPESKTPEPIDYGPYLASLPKEYDSLLNWSEPEVRCFLAGTALGSAALQDVSDSDDDGHNGALHERFTKTVLPYLTYLEGQGDHTTSSCDGNEAKRQKLDAETAVGKCNDAKELRRLFKCGCMCISTRAFHMQAPSQSNAGSSSDGAKDQDGYHGPYLLPYIDLLNHAPQGSSKHVTTLRRDADGSFIMLAERDIAADEEVCHSYDSGAGKEDGGNATGGSSSLNSAQLLQTFGFVDVEDACKRLLSYYDENGGSADTASTSLANVTPAVLAKDDVSHACKELASSSYPGALRGLMEKSGMLEEGWECWEMPELDETSPRWKSLSSFPDEIVIAFGEPLPDEVITLCCMHFLPDDAVGELLGDSTAGDDSEVLGKEVLEDYFLGHLVLKACLDALKEKLVTYEVQSMNMLGIGCTDREQKLEFLKFLGGLYNPGDAGFSTSFGWGKNECEDIGVLSKLACPQTKKDFAGALQKFKCGMVVSLEERACLVDLKRNILSMLADLDDADHDECHYNSRKNCRLEES